MAAVTFSTREPRVPIRMLAELGLIAAVIFVASYAGIAMINRENGVAPIWIANAFLIYFVLRRPRSQTWYIIATGITARFVAGLAIGSTPLSALVYSVCNLGEILIVALPLRALNAHHDFSRPKSLITFYLLAAGPAPLLAGLPAAAYAHLTRGMDFVPTLVNWYAADGLGLIVIVRMFRTDQLAKTLLYISTIPVAIAVNFFARGYPLDFLFFPAVLFLTFQRS